MTMMTPNTFLSGCHEVTDLQQLPSERALCTWSFFPDHSPKGSLIVIPHHRGQCPAGVKVENGLKLNCWPRLG